MFRDSTTIGQYYPANSILHRLDPRVKLLGVVVYITAMFVIDNIFGLIFMFATIVTLIIISKVPLRYIFKGMRFVWFLVIVSIFFNLFFSDGQIIWQWWIFRLTYEGILRAVFYSCRMLFIIVGASLLTYTTTPTTLTAGLEKAFSVLNFIHFPAHEMAMMLSIALRFIPILAEETDKIMKAQLARGADFESGGVIKKAKGMIPILIPLFVSAFRRASDLADAMESRCYHGGDGRTKMHPLKYETRDKIAYFVLLAYTGAFICVRIFLDKYLPMGKM